MRFLNSPAFSPIGLVGWALIVAYGVITISKSKYRYAIIAHPIMIVLAVTITANHYWLDGAVAAVLVVWAVVLMGRRQENIPARRQLLTAA